VHLDLAIIADETQLSKFVHEEADARTKVRQQQQKSRQPLSLELNS
jgi:hypothetical protein